MRRLARRSAQPLGRMDDSALIPGRTYYRLTFADPNMTMPGVEPLVYIGRHDSDGKMLHTFQDTISYTWVGRYPGPFRADQDIEVSLYSMSDPEAEGMLSLANVLSEFKKLEARAERLGFPELKPPHVPPRGAA
jgi:hypothetical protein